ncbi:hypothetical protein B484DRAFT_476472, partial [Ochromonadaceae sp. CCMP2298]
MSNSGAKKTKSAKTQKAVNKEFDKVINQLEKENEAFQTPHSHMVMFAIASLLAAGAPVVLYTTNSLYDGKAETRLAWFGAIWAATAAILCLTYNALATSTRKKLLLSREAAVGVPGDRADKEVKVVTANEAAYYALVGGGVEIRIDVGVVEIRIGVGVVEIIIGVGVVEIIIGVGVVEIRIGVGVVEIRIGVGG